MIMSDGFIHGCSLEGDGSNNLLGINVGGILGADHPAAFLIFCGILVSLVIGQIAILKKMKWV